jgi:hypothetical protein
MRVLIDERRRELRLEPGVHATPDSTGGAFDRRPRLENAHASRGGQDDPVVRRLVQRRPLANDFLLVPDRAVGEQRGALTCQRNRCRDLREKKKDGASDQHLVFRAPAATPPLSLSHSYGSLRIVVRDGVIVERVVVREERELKVRDAVGERAGDLEQQDVASRDDKRTGNVHVEPSLHEYGCRLERPDVVVEVVCGAYACKWLVRSEGEG